MVEKEQDQSSEIKETPKEPRSLSISKGGVGTAGDFAAMMSAVMSDVIEGTLSPPVANAVCNAGGKLLKVVEMQYKYAGKPTPNGGEQVPPSLILSSKQEPDAS